MTLAERNEVVVRGPRVTLRAFNRADVDAWQDWPDYDDPLLVATSPRRMSPDQRSLWLDDLLNRQRQVPFAVDDEHGRMIGRLFLRQVHRDEGSSVLGIDLHPGYLSQRYGTEALAVFLDHYFDNLDFQRMLLSVAAFNWRAIRSYLSLGFREVGTRWDAHAGPDVTRDPAFEHVRPYFRRGMLGLEALYYEMALDRREWLTLKKREGPPR